MEERFSIWKQRTQGNIGYWWELLKQTLVATNIRGQEAEGRLQTDSSWTLGSIKNVNKRGTNRRGTKATKN